MRHMRTSTFTKARSALCLLALAGALLAALAAGVSPAGAGGKDVTAVVPDALLQAATAEVSAEAVDNTQHWDEASQAHWFWGSPGGKLVAPTIAVVDSGVDNSNNAFGTRLLGQFDLGGGSASGDSRGHGTFVAALAAG